MNFEQFLARLGEALRSVVFISESDFTPELNPTPRAYRIPPGATIVSLDQVLASQLRQEEYGKQWGMIKQYLTQECLAATVWRHMRNRSNPAGQSNVEYLILALHPEGAVMVRARAVET